LGTPIIIASPYGRLLLLILFCQIGLASKRG
jgi:hypothetical protein